MRLTVPQPAPRAMVVAAAAALLVLVSACSSASTSQSPAGGGGGSQAAGSTITLSGLKFTVAEISVPAGDVSFVNQDQVPHLIADGQNGTEAASPRFEKASIPAGQTKVISFTAAGDYQITCLIHPTMNMVVHVQ
jgi:plastocyanin